MIEARGLSKRYGDIVAVDDFSPGSIVYKCCMEGISSRHGGHHVAQKLIKTTCPLSSERVQVFPFLSTSVKSGAGLPTSATSGAEPQPMNENRKKKVRRIKDIFFIMGSLLPQLIRVLLINFRLDKLL